MSKLIHISDKTFERLLQRDPSPQAAIAGLVYSTPLKLDDPGEAAHDLGYISTHTFNRFFDPKYGAGCRIIKDLLDFEHPEHVKGIGEKALAEIQRLRRHFRYHLRVVRREVNK